MAASIYLIAHEPSYVQTFVFEQFVIPSSLLSHAFGLK